MNTSNYEDIFFTIIDTLDEEDLLNKLISDTARYLSNKTEDNREMFRMSSAAVSMKFKILYDGQSIDSLKNDFEEHQEYLLMKNEINKIL